MRTAKKPTRPPAYIVGSFSCLVIHQNPIAPALIFHNQTKPNISLLSYISRFYHDYSEQPNPIEFEILCLCARIYILKLASMSDVPIIHKLSIHRLFATAFVIAQKYYLDSYYDNKHFAKVAGLKVTELNQLELEFCFNIDFKLEISTEEYDSQVKNLNSKLKFKLNFFSEICAKCPQEPPAQKTSCIFSDSELAQTSPSQDPKPRIRTFGTVFAENDSAPIDRSNICGHRQVCSIS